MKRREHMIEVRSGAVDLTEVPVTRKELLTEWETRKTMGFKRLFVSFLRDDTEFIYAFRFLKADLEKNTPVAQLAFIRTSEAVYVSHDMNYNYICGYMPQFAGRIKDFHIPKSMKPELEYAVPTIVDRIFESDHMKNRPHPSVLRSVNAKYGLRSMEIMKYVPDNVISLMEKDPTYYLTYIGKNRDTAAVAEMFGKLGHPECILNKAWFGLTKKELIAMVRYAQRAGFDTWNYTTIRWNMSRMASPEKAVTGETIRQCGTVKNRIRWATKFEEQKEVVRYLEKQMETLDTYEDYLKLRFELGMDSESHSSRFPSNLTEAHDRLLREQQKLNDAELAEKEKETNSRLALICGTVRIESDRFTPLIPKSTGDLRTYGKIMDNCLGASWWPEDIVSKKCFIFLLCIEKDGAQIPYLCCEARRGRKKLFLKQIYRRHNDVASKDEERYVKRVILPELENQVLLKGDRA